MTTPFNYENCWNELLNASRKWQAQYDVASLLQQVCSTAQEQLSFEYSAAFVLETSGVTEKACWPTDRKKDKAAATACLKIARDVIQAGRTILVHQPAQTLLCVPLTGSREILGALYVETAQLNRVVSDHDQQPLQMLATLGATSLEHALLYQSAITDPLTGLFCHRHFQQELEQSVRRAMRSEHPLALMLMDLDHFKELNDSSGHDAGNQCLLKVASILSTTFRSTDVVARFGGDEFEVLLPDTSSVNAAKAAEKIRQKIEGLRFGQNRQVTASIGIASFPPNASSAEDLFLNADAALYLAKEAGRNRLMVSTAIPQRTAASSSSIQSAVTTVNPAPSRMSKITPVSATTSADIVEKIDGYPVLRRLGVGSSSEVLLVEQSALKRTVALKRPLTPHLSADQIEDFEREAVVTAGLNHPGVIPIHTLGRDRDKRQYYTMRHLEGLTLDEILKRKAQGDLTILHAYTQERLLEILQRVAETIAYAHTRNVLHLDLNLKNVVVGEFGEVTVIDWASGTSWRKQTVDENSFRLVGSVAFVAPEIVTGGSTKSSKASDVFALGSLLYCLVTGQPPFQRASTRECVEALTKGELIPPDVLLPEAGIDPMLSQLCVDALAHDSRVRPTAQMFAEHLARLVRHEMDWTTIRFGPEDHVLFDSEWTIDMGAWKLTDDHWIFNGGKDTSLEGYLTWNVPVSGSFRFSCEGWIEEAGSEISIIGHRPALGTLNFRRASGYFFQLGAEENSVTKLARHEHDVLSKPCAPLEPGRRYRIDLEYQDAEGLIHCSVDKQRVFSYRELFPFSGNRIGFYGFGGRTHFRPLSIEKQNWNLQVPALRAADRTYSFGHFSEALQCYNEVSSNSSKRLSGLEATLKAGICLTAMRKPEEARLVFRQLNGTLFEPFALAEEALMELLDPKTACIERTLELFKTLFAKFPKSQAKGRIFDIALSSLQGGRSWANTYTRELEILEELNQLAVNGFGSPIVLSQLTCLKRLASLQCSLGQWDKALTGLLSLTPQLSDTQIHRPEIRAVYVEVALANNRLDLLPAPLSKNSYAVLGDLRIFPKPLRHLSVRNNEFELWQKYRNTHRPNVSLLMLQLIQGNTTEAKKSLQYLLMRPGTVSSHFELFCAVIDARVSGWLEELLPAGKMGTRTTQLLLCRYALEGQDLQTAAAHLDGILPMIGSGEDERCLFLLQTLLSSLGFLEKPTLEYLRQQQEKILAGTMLDLAKMFTGEREPQPASLWPHALWNPEWRLWLAIWLEAKGRKKEAREIVLPARDARYGLTHCQPAIEALLERTKQ